MNNKFFGHLALKHNYHKYMGYQSQEVFKKLNEYTEIHKKYSPDLYYLTKQTEVVFLFLNLEKKLTKKTVKKTFLFLEC